MDILNAVILGIIQGLTEFLPISSTAHMTLYNLFTGTYDANNPERLTAIIATVQLGTLASVLWYFAKDIANISGAFIKENISGSRKAFSRQSQASKTGWYVILGTIPIVAVGLTFKKAIEGVFTKDPIVIASALIGLALVLALAERVSRKSRPIESVTLFDSIAIGLAQCVALIPGASRSGTTITAGLFLGFEREAAARFSFLLSVPAVFASGVYEFYKSVPYLSAEEMASVAVATITAAISGWLAIAFLMKFLKKRSTMAFVIYRIALGAAILIWAY